MAGRRKQFYRGVASPVVVREPLLVKACRMFVELLPTILRTAFVLGAVLFLHEFRELSADPARTVVVDPPLPVVQEKAEAMPREDASASMPVLNDRVRHFLNCTYEEYRREHFDECVEQQSLIYRPPQPGPDESGNALYAWPVRYAGLAPRAQGEPAG